jgi:phosphoribosylglycinamide formyltransferase-1
VRISSLSRLLSNILVLVSGGGSNLQALLNADEAGEFGRGTGITAVLSDRDNAYALERAKEAGIPAFAEKPNLLLSKAERRIELSDRILQLCRKMEIDLIIQAGFLSILAGSIINKYSGRMINIHPSLLPKFGGNGMYGERVHRAVLDAGETESGCTVHFVDSGIDTGPILLQRVVPVFPEDTPKCLAERVLREEHVAIVDAVKMLVGRSSARNTVPGLTAVL